MCINLIIPACNCNPGGSHSDICDSNGGACECLDGVVGTNCSECAENHWSFSAGEGCRECSCNMTGMQVPQNLPPPPSCVHFTTTFEREADTCVLYKRF